MSQRVDDIQAIELYTIGYIEPDAEQRIDAFLSFLGSVLIDIRHTPQSRLPQFCQQALRSTYGQRYLWVPELGNIHYKPEDRAKGIQIANAVIGIPRVTERLRGGQAIMLLCACKHYEQCHRKTVYEMIMDAMKEV